METVEAHVGKMEAELKQWGVRLDKLLTKADAAGTEAKIDYRKRLDDLKEKYVAAEKQVRRAQGRGQHQVGHLQRWSRSRLARARDGVHEAGELAGAGDAREARGGCHGASACSPKRW